MKVKKHEFDVNSDDNLKRLDLFLKESLSDHSRKIIKKVIDSGGVYVNKKRIIFASHQLSENDHIEFYDDLPGKKITLNKADIIFEDSDLLVLNKPALIPAQAAYSSVMGTIIELAENYYSQRGLKQFIRLAHRLDKGTSGAIILAKTAQAVKALTAQFRDKKVGKEYIALITGAPKNEHGKIKTNIAKVKGSRTKYENVKTGGKPAVSRYELTEKLKGYSLVTVRPETGRTHQIRVHMSHLGHPVLGDELYGGNTRLLVKAGGKMLDINVNRVMLHAKAITFTHPKTRKRVTLRAKLPKDMKDIIDSLK